jgi:hypothetical protein
MPRDWCRDIRAELLVVIFVQFNEVVEREWKIFLVGLIRWIKTHSIFESGNDEGKTGGVQPAIEQLQLWRLPR